MFADVEQGVTRNVAVIWSLSANDLKMFCSAGQSCYRVYHYNNEDTESVT